ncbi:rod shape-determining protein MreC [Granulosicoccaceae sp. 1_MG-2023]|nr:rod shape-determining protein MreC [Granulosicoccaceae sp. 1_MG-2023]
MKPIFQQSPTLTLRLIVFSVLSVMLMSMETQNRALLTLRSVMSEMLYPVQFVVSLPVAAFDSLHEALASRTHLIEENRRLRDAQLIYQARLQKLALLEAENDRLHKLLSSAQRLEQRVLVAEMLAVDLDPFRQNILINKGRSDDVYLGQPVIDASGIMGQITQVSSHSSTALLISDPSHSIPVRVVRNGLRTIATGMGRPDRIKLNYIPGNGDIEVGDLLVSSGLGGRFPVDLPVGLVTEVHRPPGKAFATVYAEPAAGLDRSHEILLVWQEERDSSKPAYNETLSETTDSHWPLLGAVASLMTPSPLPTLR